MPRNLGLYRATLPKRQNDLKTKTQKRSVALIAGGYVGIDRLLFESVVLETALDPIDPPVPINDLFPSPFRKINFFRSIDKHAA